MGIHAQTCWGQGRGRNCHTGRLCSVSDTQRSACGLGPSSPPPQAPSTSLLCTHMCNSSFPGITSILMAWSHRELPAYNINGAQESQNRLPLPLWSSSQPSLHDPPTDNLLVLTEAPHSGQGHMPVSSSILQAILNPKAQGVGGSPSLYFRKPSLTG